MNDNQDFGSIYQMSVQLYGYNFGGTGVFHFFFCFYAFLSKIGFRFFGDFQTLLW